MSFLVTLFHTVRYLRPVQIYGRLWFKVYRPKVQLDPAPALRLRAGNWVSPAQRKPSLLRPWQFRFLNEEHSLNDIRGWDDPGINKLWRYNLHYFDDLNASNAPDRCAWHIELIDRWLVDNSPGYGIGWDPYPLSLRIVNWVKWALAGNPLEDNVRHSLAIQVRYLNKRLERHLLGNHLFANAKALVFAGSYFEGQEAEDWLSDGMRILAREIPEQILSDGGHFERSTMYHALAYEDMLDLVNLTWTYSTTFASWQGMISEWPALIERMGRWLSVMCHPDGEISFFNDAAMGIAPSLGELFAYAHRLGLATLENLFRRSDMSSLDKADAQPATSVTEQDVIWLKESGYIRVKRDNTVLLIDVAPLGPDYLPAHAHADTLSYELSVYGRRVVVNSGTSRYGLGVKRDRERATAAHNTLEIDGEDSSEVWAGFRVARRARPFDINVEESTDYVVIEAAHDGYCRLSGKPIHKRRWVMSQTCLEVVDTIEGRYSEAVSRVHLHPDLKVQSEGGNGTVTWMGEQIRWQSTGAVVKVEHSSWHPEFGISIPSTCLSLHLEPSSFPSKCKFRIEWD